MTVPVITPAQAQAEGVSASSLRAVARWHQGRRDRTRREHHARMTRELRAVANQLQRA